MASKRCATILPEPGQCSIHLDPMSTILLEKRRLGMWNDECNAKDFCEKALLLVIK
jgi:hypothetical protein